MAVSASPLDSGIHLGSSTLSHAITMPSAPGFPRRWSRSRSESGLIDIQIASAVDEVLHPGTLFVINSTSWCAITRHSAKGVLS